MEDISSLETVVLKSGEDIYKESSASLRSIYLLGGFYKVSYILLVVPPFLRNWIYKLISRNRIKWFGKRDTCRIPDKGEQERILI